jgi:hypothetical protein
MKQILLFIVLMLLFGSACKKSGENGQGSLPVNSCVIDKMTSISQNDTSTILFYRDSSGKLLYTKETYQPGDTSYLWRYHYNNGVLDYSIDHNGAGILDTTFYFYSSYRLDHTLEHVWLSARLLTTRTRYIYNTNNQVITSVAEQSLDTAIFQKDSLIYQYSGKNISTILDYQKSTYSDWVLYTLLLTYDNMKNFYKAMGCPATDYCFWTENNITKITVAESSSTYMTTNFNPYNGSGYPLSATAINNPDLFVTSVTISYLCQ